MILPWQKDKVDYNSIVHDKKSSLTTPNEKKLFFVLRKVLGDKYLIHCQTSVIALVEPQEKKHKARAWTKRVDFVITDLATNILAVIELDDASHQLERRQERDAYVNAAINPHHPLIRIPTSRFYEPVKVAELLESHSSIKCIAAIV